MPRTAQRLVVFLALHDRSVGRNHLRGTLWPDTSEEQAAANLRSALWRLRRIGRDVVETVGDALRLGSQTTVDLRDAVALARLAITSPAWWVPEERDITLLSDDLLPSWDDEWILVERERFRQLRLHALEGLCTRLSAMGRHSAAVQAGLVAVGADSLRESAQSALIRAFLAEGNVGEACRQLERFRSVLGEELGVAPSLDLEKLVRSRKW